LGDDSPQRKKRMREREEERKLKKERKGRKESLKSFIHVKKTITKYCYCSDVILKIVTTN
jgi:hypothetical protein